MRTHCRVGWPRGATTLTESSSVQVVRDTGISAASSHVPWVVHMWTVQQCAFVPYRPNLQRELHGLKWNGMECIGERNATPVARPRDLSRVTTCLLVRACSCKLGLP